MNYLKNKWTLFIIVFFLIFSLILITNCESNKRRTNYRYEIRGYVIHNGKQHDAIWLTDTLEIGDNFLKYHNSDGTEVVIPSPYILIDHGYDKVIRDTVPAF